MTVENLGVKLYSGLKSDRVDPIYNPAWEEVDRTTLTSDGAVGGSITVSNIPTSYKYLQVLYNLKNGSNGNVMLLGRVNGSGSNYEERGISMTGSSDTPFNYGSNDYWNMGLADGSYDSFGIQHITSQGDSQARRGIYNECVHNGSGNSPKTRRDFLYRGDTSATTEVEAWSYGDGRAYGDGSEVVVLGLNPSATSTDDVFWKYLGGDTLTGTSDNLTTDTITAKKYLWLQAYVKATGDAGLNLSFNNDNASNYIRVAAENDSDSTSTTAAYVGLDYTANDYFFVNAYICNNASSDSLMFYDVVSASGTGASVIPNKIWGCAKWVNTNQITEVNIDNDETGVDYSAKSFIKVWGSD